MDQETLRKVQLTLLEIALEFKRVCNILRLNFFLDSGTLLGAVRHKGFIPWDDDFDVGMLRKDYECFIEKAQELLHPDFFLQTWDTDKNYGLPFAKLRMRNTVYIEEVAQKTKAENGFYLDIFPYDVYPTKKMQRIIQGLTVNCIRRAILIKDGYQPWLNDTGGKRTVKKLGYIPLRLYAFFHKKESLIRKYEKDCTKFNSESTGFLYEQAGASNYGKWVIPCSCLTETIDLVFENTEFSCPAGYDEYLKAVYGDYMKLPPVEQRYNRHRIIKVQFKVNKDHE